ncbi:aminotransferase class I/II-fold pyridoxal phosphate-dependent enzyme [Paludicola sp. MB14-C6]|uniref:aminotransferase class I/II-fold pyridoxal phosphate-dependent enzyme n=1 Tax=Paludihabitans sp. MB14-C6 TaxID=3070656 RepID=UPI0027DCCDA0|nr:aminotransferase class I/II-fold pyridoxal phosphate-dependent enzyme [Paludicola sp. MB14-C6]WMJ22497.1 aminotransferase class I/II-fold pyridoxal phosphate-dependent enzyme [Paludicola sp. MB14-C6]
MKNYQSMSKEELQSEYDILLSKYNEMKQQGLSLDMSRGKPAPEQLDLAMPMLDILTGNEMMNTENGFDTRNYGILDGIPEAKKLFADMLELKPENILVGGNSSLNMMYDSVARSMSFGVMGSTPWNKLEKVKFLCPVPGYDRHFAICELFGIEMINIPMDNKGPNMDMVEELVANDDSIKGIWCVPKYSNPSGITYSAEVVKRFGALKPKANDFRIYWDNAYVVHDLTETPDELVNIYEECKKNSNEDMVFEFASTSKISFSGAGIAVMGASVDNLNFIRKHLTIQTIGFDKMNQLRHVKYYKDINGIKEHMKKHKEIIAPKFDAVINALNTNIAPYGIATYETPNGGYFISFNTMSGCAKRVGQLCKDAGLVMTPSGATFPYGNDPDDSNIRIAPTYPSIEELNTAMELFCYCVKIATIEKLLK